MKSFKDCYDIFEGVVKDVWKTCQIGYPMKFRSSEYYILNKVTIESFINDIQNTSLCFILFDPIYFTSPNDVQKCLKKLYEMQPILFGKQKIYDSLLNILTTKNIEGLIIRNGKIDEITDKSDVVSLMHNAFDDRKAFNIEFKGR